MEILSCDKINLLSLKLMDGCPNNLFFVQTLESLQAGVAALGSQIVEGVDVIADTLTSLGGVLPELFFSSYQENDNDEAHHNVSAHVIVGDHRAKRRLVNEKPLETSPVAVNESSRVDNVEEDWSKED